MTGCWGCRPAVGCGCRCRELGQVWEHPTSLLRAKGDVFRGSPGTGLPLWHLPRSLLFPSLAARGAFTLRSRCGSLGELIKEPEVLSPFIPGIYSDRWSQGSGSLLILSLQPTPVCTPRQKLASWSQTLHLQWYSGRDLGFLSVSIPPRAAARVLVRRCRSQAGWVDQHLRGDANLPDFYAIEE